jgi:DNA-damage-inducible protein D
MADTNKLAEVVATLAERDEEFRPIEQLATQLGDDTEEVFWSLRLLKSTLGYEEHEDVASVVNRAKIAASKAGWGIKEHFRDGTLHDGGGELFLSKYAAYLFVTGCDPNKQNVATALAYFALQVNRQSLEDEKRLRTRLDVATENHRLAGIASDHGVENFQKFNGAGIQGLYGGKTVSQLVAMKRLPQNASYLDYAGSEELAANLFRITQTAAALRRQEFRNENRACNIHRQVGAGIRQTILDAGNTPPEHLKPAELKIDRLASQKSKQLKKN